MIPKKVWKELITRQKHVYALSFILAHESELIKLQNISSVLEVSKQRVYVIVKEVIEVLQNNKIDLTYTSTQNGLIITINEKPQPQAQQSKDADINVQAIIEYLNQKAKKKFLPNNKMTIRDINARIKEGYKFDDFKKVIDIKVEKWLGTNMEDYIRPQTLFGQKFNSYLNERPQKQQSKPNTSKIENAIREVQRDVDWGLD